MKTLTLGASAQADFLKDTATVFEEGPRKMRYLEMALQKYNEILPLDPKVLILLLPQAGSPDWFSPSACHLFRAKGHLSWIINTSGQRAS